MNEIPPYYSLIRRPVYRRRTVSERISQFQDRQIYKLSAFLSRHDVLRDFIVLSFPLMAILLSGFIAFKVAQAMRPTYSMAELWADVSDGRIQ